MRLVMPPILMLTCAAIASSVTITPVFTPGEGGYASFRIPGVVQAGDAHLAFAEGRKYACTDFGGQHDIVSKRSEDGGISWGPLQVIADPEKLFGCQNGSKTKSGYTLAALPPGDPFSAPTLTLVRATASLSRQVL